MNHFIKWLEKNCQDASMQAISEHMFELPSGPPWKPDPEVVKKIEKRSWEIFNESPPLRQLDIEYDNPTP